MAKNKSLPFFFSPLAAAGIIFLANPVFGVVDILPDVFGCLCLWLALTELSYTESRIDTARSRLLLLAAIEGIKLVLTPTLYKSAVSSDTLAASAFFGVIEGLLLILAFSSFYEGLAYAVSRKGDGESLKIFDGAKALCFVFVVLRILMNIIPECAALFELAAHTDITNAELYYSIAGLKNYFHLLNALIVTIAGVWWGISLNGIFRKLRRDAVFTESLAVSYGDGYSRNLRAKTAYWIKNSARIVMLALVFFFNFDFGYRSMLPNFVATALLLLGIAALGIPLKKRLHKKFSLPVVLYAFAVQIGAYVYRALNVDLTIEFFTQLVWTDVVICGVIGLAEFVSFILIAKMCEKIFNEYVLEICGERNAKLMYSVKIAVYASGFIYWVSYTLPLLRGYLVLPQIVALIAIGAIINANANFVRGCVENPEEKVNLCADL